jgi:hypothetical protein
MVEFQSSWVPMCHNCAAKTLQLTPVPPTLEGVRQRLGRDRRWSDWSERRVGKKDHRIFAIERRRGQRRDSGERDEGEWLDAEDFIIEIVDSDDVAEATRISTAEERERRESL